MKHPASPPGGRAGPPQARPDPLGGSLAVSGERGAVISPLIRLHANDNVLVARQPIGLGQELPEFGLRMRAQVPAGHKIAARRIAAGETVKKTTR